ncbi:MAG: sigma-54 dependent transcriptional regulator, partial [Kiritimatiellia bacterium]
MSTLLIVDDDKSTRDGIVRALHQQYTVFSVADAEAALATLNTESVDLVLTDLRMPGRDGLSLLRDIMTSYPKVQVILLSAYGSVESAVEAMKEGAYDFLTKPVNLDHLELIVRRALRQKNLESQNATLRLQLAGRTGLSRMVGESSAMEFVRERIEQTAPTPATVLIQGPSGTGKELVARAIHLQSPRAKGPFVAVHCAALSPSLLESELFGHVKGAFTGATEDHKGRFELADGGTLFLDEISEIDLATQVKLLRVLETRSVEPVGSAVSIPVNIRLVAATNRNLKAWVDEGKFREDLYFRLNVVDINLPPLREREGDLPLLCHAFIQELNVQLGKQILGIEPEVLEAFAHYDWPGNIRELRNTLEKMMVLTHHDRLMVEDIPPSVRPTIVSPVPSPVPS